MFAMTAWLNPCLNEDREPQVVRHTNPIPTRGKQILVAFPAEVEVIFVATETVNRVE